MAELRNVRFHMLMSPTERSMLETLAEAQGLTESDIIRMAIREKYKQAYGDKPPRKAKPKPKK